jgi:hypothetical protein
VDSEKLIEVEKDIEIFLDIINEIVRKKNTRLSDKVLNKLINILKIINKINISELKGKMEVVKDEIIEQLNLCCKLDTKVKGRKKKVKALSPSDYRGEFSEVIELNVHKVRELLIN